MTLVFRVIRQCLVIALLLVGTASGAAQSAAGKVQGIVSDSTGGRIPNVEVHIVHVATSRKFDVLTDEEGLFRVANLQSGAYSIEIATPGFAKKRIELVIQAGEIAELNETLSPEAVSEEVRVSASAELLQPNTATQTATLSGTELVVLPAASRNYTHLLVAEAGIAAPLPERTGRGMNIATTPGDQADDATQSINPSVNGARPSNNSLRVNGIDTTNLLNAGGGLGNNLNIPLDALDEVGVQTALYSASAGRNGGGNVGLTTRSGGNEIHGTLYHYLQHERLNANEFFLNRAGNPRPRFRRNESGGTFGGPIFRDKTFFFAAVQRTDFLSGYASNATAAAGLPTALTDIRTRETITGVANEWLRTAAADNSRFAQNFMTALRAFPADQQDGLIRKFFTDPVNMTLRTLTPADIHPVAINILNTKRDGRFLIPTPGSQMQTLPGNGTFGREYLLQQVIPTGFNSWSGYGSVEHNVTARNRMRFNFVRADQKVEEAFGWADASPSPTLGDTSGYVASISNQHTFNPRTANDLRVGFFDLSNTRISKFRDIKNSDLGIYNPLEYGIGGLAALMPTIDITTQRNSGGIGNAWDFFDNQKVLNIVNTLSFFKGAHSLQLGGEYRRIRITGEFMSRTNGDLDYDNWVFFFTGHGAASGSSDLDQGDTRRNLSATDYSLFVQDDWRVRSGLTLNLGLRYDFLGNYTEANGRIGNYYSAATAARMGVEPGFYLPSKSYDVIMRPDFDPLQIGLVVDPGTPLDLRMIHRANTESTLTSDRNNFAPHIGFAWQPQRFRKFVFRGGYGLFYERASASYKVDIQRSAPFFIFQNVPAPPDMADPYPRLNVNPFQIPFNVQIARDADGAASWRKGDGSAFPAQSPFNSKNNAFIDPFIRTPYVQQWSFNVQFTPVDDIIIDTRYVGSRGVGLLGKVNLSQPYDPRTQPVNGFTDIYDLRGRLINPDFFVGPEFLGLNRSGGFAQLSNWGHSVYHGLQVGFRGSMLQRVNWNTAYTFSKSLDNLSSNGSLAEHDGRNLAGNRGVSDFDRPHRLTTFYSLRLPELAQRNALVRTVAGSWRLSGLLTVQSGSPFSAIGAATRNAIFAQPGRVRLDYAAGMTLADSKNSGRIQDRLDNYFDVTAFQDSVDRWGNTGRNILRGPRQSQFDIAISKQASIREGSSLEFRWELFNAFNTPTFGNPNSTFAANGFGTAGRITSTIGGPRTMQAALRFQF